VLVGALLAHGADYTVSVAAAVGDQQRIEALLRKDASLARRLDSARRSPLSYAAREGHLHIIRLLLEHGADPNRPEDAGPDGRALYEACTGPGQSPRLLRWRSVAPARKRAAPSEVTASSDQAVQMLVPEQLKEVDDDPSKSLSLLLPLGSDRNPASQEIADPNVHATLRIVAQDRAPRKRAAHCPITRLARCRAIAVRYFRTFGASGAAMGGEAGREAAAGGTAEGDFFMYLAIGMS
jgi:Ankyrin repeats (3 copies)